MKQTTVYRFKRYDINSDKEIISRFHAIREAIEQFKGTAIEDSAIEIDDSLLDSEGALRS
jgi:hypothetical protein